MRVLRVVGLGVLLGCQPTDDATALTSSTRGATLSPPVAGAANVGSGSGSGDSSPPEAPTDGGLDAGALSFEPGREVAVEYHDFGQPSGRIAGEDRIRTWGRAAADIGLVRCTSATPHWVPGTQSMIATQYTFVVERVLRGNPPDSLQQGGGTIGDTTVSSPHAPSIRPGGRYVVFFASSGDGPVLFAAPSIGPDETVWISDRYVPITRITELLEEVSR